MTKKIHINQHNIKANRKDGGKRPVITCKTYKSNDYGHEVKVFGQCKVVYQPDNPMSCGAHVWIEAQGRVLVINEVDGEREVTLVD